MPGNARTIKKWENKVEKLEEEVKNAATHKLYRTGRFAHKHESGHADIERKLKEQLAAAKKKLHEEKTKAGGTRYTRGIRRTRGTRRRRHD